MNFLKFFKKRENINTLYFIFMLLLNKHLFKREISNSFLLIFIKLINFLIYTLESYFMKFCFNLYQIMILYFLLYYIPVDLTLILKCIFNTFPPVS